MNTLRLITIAAVLSGCGAAPAIHTVANGMREGACFLCEKLQRLGACGAQDAGVPAEAGVE